MFPLSYCQGASNNHYAKNEMPLNIQTVSKTTFHVVKREHITDSDDIDPTPTQHETHSELSDLRPHEDSRIRAIFSCFFRSQKTSFLLATGLLWRSAHYTDAAT